MLAANGIGNIGKPGVDVEVRATERRGNGLFALRDFEPGELVVRYSGRIAKMEEFQEAYDAGLTDGTYIANANTDGSVIVDAEDAATSGLG